MAMNFWEAQQRAKSRTTLYVTLFILLTLVVAFFAETAMHVLLAGDYDPPIPYVGLLFLAITFSVTLYQYGMYNSFGGSYVAESVGARRIQSNTSDFHEKQLLNIVEEIALAASLPVPPVYIMQANEINAFAAGLHPNKAAIAITRGALEKLRRDEVQGVIAHEFGHIANGDMKISMRLAAMVMGFFFVLYFGMRVMQFASYSRGDDRNERGAGNAVALAALVLVIAGSITWFFGSLLKASVSREREYLADASAVQFTRNPDGIANALRRIALDSKSDMPNSGLAYSHMYFDDRTSFSSLFATHPPLAKRIAAIEGRTYIPTEWDIQPENKRIV